MDDENKLITERKKKLEEIRKNYIAYPNSFRKKELSKYINKKSGAVKRILEILIKIEN